MDKRLLIVIACILILTASGWALYRYQKPKRGDRIIERWESGNAVFKIRVSAYPEENGGYNAGAYYVFDSITTTSNKWHKIMIFRHDGAVPIPRDQIRFVGDEIAFVFMGWMYAVTTDGGKNWSVWNAEDDLPNWECCNYRLIADATIAGNGTGVMRLSPIRDRRGEVPELRTDDYGKHWRPK